VRDDGVGGAAPRPGGFGLTSMLERVQGLHGSLAIESEPGSGTAVSASVPLPPARLAASWHQPLREPSSPLRS
jgi:nitrate/nitrite-specific signal transduction histidine kinase